MFEPDLPHAFVKKPWRQPIDHGWDGAPDTCRACNEPKTVERHQSGLLGLRELAAALQADSPDVAAEIQKNHDIIINSLSYYFERIRLLECGLYVAVVRAAARASANQGSAS